MKATIAAFLAALVTAVSALPVDAHGPKKKKNNDGRQADSPAAVAERQKHKRTFDETQYYERLSEKIPFGSPAWWRQKQIESTNE